MGGYKDTWFDEYERLYNEREDGEVEGTDEQLANMAHDRVVDKIADAADRAKDRRKYGE